MGDITLATVNLTGVNTEIILHPTWAFAAEERVIRSATRTLTGQRFDYRWGGFAAYRLPLQHVGGAERELLTGWWRSRETLLLTLDTSADLSAVLCRIANRGAPLTDRVAPLKDNFAGVLHLEALNSRKNLGKPFILDHPQWGQLDHPNISLI